MFKTVKVKLYPNKLQKECLEKHFGCSRFVYNAALNYKIYLYQNYKIQKSKFDISNEIPDLKEEFTFLKVGQNMSKLNASGDERLLLSKKEELLLATV